MREVLLFAAFGLLSVAALAHEGHDHGPAVLPGKGGVQSLDVYADGGAIHLLTGEEPAGGGPRTLWYRRSDDGGRTWSPPVKVNGDGKGVATIERGSDAQIAARGRRVLAAWTAPGTGWGGSGPLATAISEDGGKTWRPGPNPADDGSTKGHDYINLAADGTRFHLVWVDGRDGAEGLRYARSEDGGATWSANRTIAVRTCECCCASLTASADGTLELLYRGVGPRDMVLATSTDGGATWQDRGRVGKFGWDVDACFRAGGALGVAPSGNTLHALVWTGRDDAVGLYRLTSSDGGADWTSPRRVGAMSARHSDLAVAAEGSITAVWDEGATKGSLIFRSQSSNGGKSWSRPERVSDEGMMAAYPRVVASGKGFTVLWTEAIPGRPALLKADGRTLPPAEPGGAGNHAAGVAR